MQLNEVPEATREGASSPGDGVRSPTSPEVEVTYYTDPLCSWSWAFEPQWRRLLVEFSGRLASRYVMGGMIPDWQSYQDPMNSVHKPGQMGPLWYQVRQLTGMPIDERIWAEDPPASSYPACLAVKAAGRQGPEAAAAFLRRLREAVMLGRRNIARTEVLLQLADALASDPASADFDAGRFRADLADPGAASALREDLREARDRDIGRFPTLVLRRLGGPGLILVGYRPYDVLLQALDRLVPGLRPVPQAADVVAYATRWGRVLDREVAEAFGVDLAAAREALEAASAGGALCREEAIPGCYRPGQ